MSALENLVVIAEFSPGPRNRGTYCCCVSGCGCTFTEQDGGGRVANNCGVYWPPVGEICASCAQKVRDQNRAENA